MTTATHEFNCAEEETADRVGGDQIKSRDRVRDLAEVFTHHREVEAMLDLVPDMFQSIDTTFLEPASGHGNFLVEILNRKLALIEEDRHGGTENWFEFAVLRIVSSIYAVDISMENVEEARGRMSAIIASEFKRLGRRPTFAFEAAVATVLDANVVCGDALNGASEITFFEWRAVDGERFARIPVPLEEPEYDLFHVPPDPIPPVHYSDLGRDCDK